MAITFLEQKKKQQKLVLLLAGLIALAALIFLWSFLSKPKPQAETLFPDFSSQKLQINWDILTNEAIEGLQAFEEISPSQEEAGRANPFISY